MHNSLLWIDNEDKENRREQRRAAVSSHRQLCFSEEEKMRFSGVEKVLHRLKMLQKSIEKECRDTQGHQLRNNPTWGTFVVPSPDGDSQARRGKAIIKKI